MRWFRFYDDALNDPKVQRLPPDAFKTWVNLLCLASKNGGTLPSISEISFALRAEEDDAVASIEVLVRHGLIDQDEDGTLRPHNWAGRQYASDDSTQRSRKHRMQRCSNGEGNVPATPQNRTEQSQKQIQKEKTLGASAPEFDAFFKAYPQRGPHPNPKKPARLKFEAAVKRGVEAQKIIAAAKAFAASSRGTDPQFIPQAVTWLSQERWADAVEKPHQTFTATYVDTGPTVTL